MRAADASRVCQYPDPSRPHGICGRHLSGRGRHKWCQFHQIAVRADQRAAGNAKWQRAWRERNRGVCISNSRIPRMVNSICNILRRKYVFVYYEGLRAELLRDLCYLFSTPRLRIYERRITYSFSGDGVDALLYRSSEQSKQHTQSVSSDDPPENNPTDFNFACILVDNATGIPNPLFNHMRNTQDESGAMPIFYSALKIWTVAMGWNRDTPALVIRLRAVSKRTDFKKEYYYVEFRDSGRYRRAIFWLAEPKDLRAKDPRSRLMRLLWRWVDETGRNEELWVRSMATTIMELNKDCLAEFQTRDTPDLIVKPGRKSAKR
jgi:hypothetical protein